MSLSGTLAGLLSSQPTVTVFLETVAKDVSEDGLRNMIYNSGIDILHHRLRLRKREHFNQADIYLASIRDAKLMVQFLEEKTPIKNLSPKILIEEEEREKLNKLELREAVSEALKDKEPDEVFVMNRPHASKRKIEETTSEGPGKIPITSFSGSVKSLSRRSEVSQASQQEPAREEVHLNQPSQVDDDTFRANFEKRMKQKKDREESNEKVDQAAAEGLNVSASSEDSVPPFYREDDEGWRRAEDSLTSNGPTHNQSSGLNDFEFRAQEPSENNLVGASEVSKDSRDSPHGDRHDKISPEVKDQRRDPSRDYDSFGRIIMEWPKLPKNCWVEADIIGVAEGDRTTSFLPIFLIRPNQSHRDFDVTFDFKEFELDGKSSKSLCEHLKQNLPWRVFVRRLDWIEGEELNLVEMKRNRDDALGLAYKLCQLGWLKGKNFDSRSTEEEKDEDEDIDEDVTIDEITAKIVLQDGSLVYWKDFGKSGNYARLMPVEEKERDVLQDIMCDTDFSKIVDPQPGQIVAISDPDEDGNPLYTRAEILKVKSSTEKVLCQLVDSEGKKITSFQNVHPLPPAARNIPPQCPELELDEIPDIPRTEAKEKLSPFLGLVHNQKFVLRIMNEQEKIVQLYGVDGESFNELLAEIFRGEHDDQIPISEAEKQEKRALRKKEKERPVERDEKEVRVVEPLAVDRFSSYRTLLLGQEISVRVLHFVSWSNFYVCDEAQYQQLNLFQV